MPGDLDSDALGFLCFGWAAAAAVGSVAARDITYFFGGMVAERVGRRRGFGRRNGEERGA